MSENNTSSTPSRPEEEIRVITSEEILNGSNEVHIRHGDAIYRLRVTKVGKLILSK